MVALFVLFISLAFGAACSAQDVAPEPLPPLLQPAEYAAPMVEPQEMPFQEMDGGCGDECVDCGPMCVQQSYWYGGVDVLATQFSYELASFVYFADDDTSVGIRPYVGWESTSGVGIRGRWWFYETEATKYPSGALNQPLLYGPLEVNVNSLDLDFYRRFHYDKTSFLLGVGSKIASVDLSYSSVFSNYDIVGGGLSVFAEGQHPLYLGPKNEWAFIGYGRFGLLTGQIKYDNRPSGWEYSDTNMSITELGLGLEWKHKFRRGDFICQFISEIQRWETNMTSDLAFDSVGLRFGGQW